MMSETVRKKGIDEVRAAELLGLTRDQLRQLYQASGLGREEAGTTSGQRVFTYEELYRLCCLATRAAA
jgi:DNA-binding transcriptional MerR regulator